MLKYSLITILILIVAFLAASQQESFEFGKRMYRDGFFQEAIVVFERITTTAPQSAEAEESMFLLGEIYRSQERFRDAELLFRRFYESYPTSSWRENALYNWSFSLYKQDKYAEAVEMFNAFNESYPNSSNRAEAHYYLISSYYNISAHQAVTQRGQQFSRDFSTNHRIPDIMYYMAISYQKTNRFNDADNTLKMIIRDYPLSDARWEAVMIQGAMIQEERGVQPAIEHFTSQLNNNIPRQYEETILYKIAGLYLKTNDYSGASGPLSQLITKYDRSPQLAEYLYLYALSLSQQNRYQSIIDSYTRVDLLEIMETPYYYDYLIQVAAAFFNLNRFEQTEVIISEIAGFAVQDAHRFGVLYWQARLQERQHRLFDAVSSYHHLLATYPSLVTREELLKRIGNIYFDQLQLYQNAINYYNQIITGVGVTSKYHWTALYKTALCYEIMGNYNEALNALRQINMDYVANENDRREILNRTEVISQFKSVDYEMISANLISALFQYVDTDNKEQLREQLIMTMLLEMKDIEGVLALLEQDRTPRGIFLRGKAYLKSLHKADLEMRTADRRHFFDQLNKEIGSLNKQTHPMYVEELEIERNYITNNYTLAPEVLSKAENYISQYPQSPATNRFTFLVGYQYLRNGQYSAADRFLGSVTRDREIPLVQYEQALVAMGNHHFADKQYNRVIAYFNRIEGGLTINRAEELYRYAVSLIETGEETQGMNRLEFLVKNSTNFESRGEAIGLITSHYRELQGFNSVVAYMLLFPESERSRDYYLQLSEDYLMVDDKVKAKEALMYIPEKDVEVLLKLADLHYQTGDLPMAEYTYSSMLRDIRDKRERLLVQSNLAHIHFVRENWREALANYDPVLVELGDSINAQQYSYLNLVRIGKETVISLYRVQNRPRADTVKQRFQNILRNDQAALAEIELNESIYQMTVNRTSAERGFSDIIRNQNLPENLRMQAYFWRGINHLENKKVNEAKADFQSVLSSRDTELLNQAHLKLGTISFSQQQYQQALEHYAIVIQNDSRGDLAFDAAKNYAIVCKTIEDWPQAIEVYEIILEKWGVGELEGETHFNIGYCQYRDRKYTDALRSFEKALPLLTDREIKAEAQYWIGESYFSMNQFENAATEYLKVGYFYPEFIQWNAISELKLAESYIRQGRNDNARSILNKIIEKYGRSSDWGKQALIYLEQI